VDSNAGDTSVGVYTGISHLIGTAGYAFLLTGAMNGRTGTNAIHFTSRTIPTSIHLDTGQATGVISTTSMGVVTNIQNVFGPGSAAFNVMDGWAGDDNLSGLSENNIVVGNYGTVNMNGGAGIDILIGNCFGLIVRSLQDRLESIMSFRINVTDGTFNLFSYAITTASPTYLRLVGNTNLVSTYLL